MAANPINYLFGAAKFYLTLEQDAYRITNFIEMKDPHFNKAMQ
jgi:hypothetical protein